MSKEKKEQEIPEAVPELTLHEKLCAIQTSLKVPKSNLNKFGGYKYRSNEDILKALKPHLKEHGLTFIQRDEIIEVGGRVYVKATSTLYNNFYGSNGGASISISNTAFARESLAKKGMDDSQITGTASSYARKYSANGLFLLDDTADADTTEFGKENRDRASEQEKAWHKCISDWYGRCENEEDVVKMQAWILKKDGIAHYTDYIDKKAQSLIDGFTNKTTGGN